MCSDTRMIPFVLKNINNMAKLYCYNYENA